MTITNKYKRIRLAVIKVRADRQRREVVVDDLLSSISKRGVVHPVIVEDFKDGYYGLIAGERRYRASERLGIPDIPCRMVEDLNETERQILELEENVKRKDLDWKEEVSAVRRIHQLYTQSEVEWTQGKTAESIGMQDGLLSIMLKVAEELDRGNAMVAAATGYRPAYNIIMRREGRLADDAMNDMLAPEEEPGPPPVVLPTVHLEVEATPTPIAKLAPRPESILTTDFREWVKSYRGQPFSLIHCDFPYGIGLDRSEQAGSSGHGGYEDSDDTYWDLCTCLCKNLDKIMMQSAHLFFWTSTNVLRQAMTLAFFKAHAPELDFIPVPLVWLKTDNKGILPDPKRGPRYITETAFMASRGDRHIIRSVSNAYGAPTVKDVHQSEKPEPMLRHFFAMFVDENTRFFDPTCGSGSALRAAESLGAKHVLGLEHDSDHAEGARIALRKSRNLRALEKKS